MTIKRTFSPDDAMRFDLDETTAVLRQNLEGARWEKSSARIQEAEIALLAHVDAFLGLDSTVLTPERRAKAIELFGKPFGS